MALAAVVVVSLCALGGSASASSMKGWIDIASQFEKVRSQDSIRYEALGRVALESLPEPELVEIWNAAIDNVLHAEPNSTDKWYANYVGILQDQVHKAAGTRPLRSVGIYDSGVGGLTVWRVQQRRLSALNVTFFGDDQRAPYGDKDPADVALYVQDVLARLSGEYRSDAALIACNTASIAAIESGVLSLPAFGAFPVIPIVPPYGVFFKLASEKSLGRRIGMFATDGTCTSGVYQHLIRQADEFQIVPNTIDTDRFPSQAITTDCVGCAECVEAVQHQGAFNTSSSTLWRAEVEAVLRVKFASYLASGLDFLILGCTHFPLLEPIIKPMFPDVTFVDPALYQTEFLARIRHANSNSSGHSHFVVSEAHGPPGDSKYMLFSQVADGILSDMGVEQPPVWTRVLDDQNALGRQEKVGFAV